jgi:hypothetical protein
MTQRRFSLEVSSFFLPVVLGLVTACGEPETNPWHGKTYLLDITSRNWAEPRGIGQDIDDFVPNFLLRVDGDAPDAFDVTLGTADATGVQDGCNMTSVLGATASPPGVTIGPDRFPLHVQHVDEPIAVDGTIYDLTIKDVLPDGDAPSVNGELTATMDFRELYPLFTLLVDPTPETVCAAFEMTYTTTCAPCPNDGEPFCLTVKANTLGAVPSDSAIEPVAAVDPSCTPTPEP